MRDRDDDPIDFDDLPSIQTEVRDAVKPDADRKKAEKVKAKPAPASGGGMQKQWVTGLFLLLILAVGALGWQLYQQSQVLDVAENRLAKLEEQLSTTDESISQSSVAMQVRLSKLKDRTDELWTQMDKLWASAWRRNQSELSEQGDKIDKVQKTLAGLEKTVDSQKQAVSTLRGDVTAQNASVEGLQQDVNKLLAAQKGQSEQQKAIDAMRKELSALSAQQKALQQKIDENAGWVESNNAFRQQTNQTLTRLEQQIRALQSGTQ